MEKKEIKAADKPTMYDLRELLRGCEGVELYSVVDGPVRLIKIYDNDDDNDECLSIVTRNIATGAATDFTAHGYWRPEDEESGGECLLFPSRDQRDWSKWTKPGHEYVVGDGVKPMEPRCYRDYFSRLLKRLGIAPIVFHGLRHTFATRCIESGCDCKTVSVILGHSNVSTTLNLYVHPNLDQKKACIAKMNKFLRLD